MLPILLRFFFHVRTKPSSEKAVGESLCGCPAASAAVVTHLVLGPLLPISGQAIGHHGPGPGHDRLRLDLGPPGAP